jgi:hypothetical protein
MSIDHSRVEYTRLKDVDGTIALNFPVDKMDAHEFPPVTIITITKNRKKYFPLAINNWNRIYYPYDKLTWLIVDDSEDPHKDGPIELLKPLKDKRIKYYYLKPEPYKVYTIGYKRNFAMGLVQTEYVVNMDDDDFLYKESVMSRICAMKFYDKQCVYSESIGVYNLKHESSYILEGFSDIPEGTMAYTKTFWEKNKYNESLPGNEGLQMVLGRELEMVKIPYFFNLIVINHANNTTGRTRNIRIKQTGQLKTIKSTTSSINFKKFMTEDFITELDKLSN